MITLDKILIVAPIENIAILNDKVFTKTTIEGRVTTAIFDQKQPFELHIKIDYLKRESVIEFTGKILLDEYIHLIHKDNIRSCLNRIEELKVCEIDVEMVLNEGIVSKIDVTKDVSIDDCKSMSDYLRGHISNYKKHNATLYNDNLVLWKEVKTPSAKRRLTFYDKYNELTKAGNRAFLACLKDKDALLDYFKGKGRFELNLYSIASIKKELKISDTKVRSVLESQENPIASFIEKVISDDVEVSCSSAKERLYLALLRECDMDVKRVYEELKPLYSPKTHMSQVIEPFQQLLTKLTNKDAGKKVKESLLNLLL